MDRCQDMAGGVEPCLWTDERGTWVIHDGHAVPWEVTSGMPMMGALQTVAIVALVVMGLWLWWVRTPR